MVIRCHQVRARERPLGSLVEHLMREVLSGHQVSSGESETTKANQRRFERLEISEHTTGIRVNWSQSGAIRGHQRYSVGAR